MPAIIWMIFRIEALRKAVGILVAEAVARTANVGSTANGATASSSAQAAPSPPTAKELGEAQSALIGEAQRVAGLTKMTVPGVVDGAAKVAVVVQEFISDKMLRLAH